MREIFMVISFQQLHPLIIAAVVSAAGALVMHYTGMMALHGPFRKEWNYLIIIASAATAVVVCFAGFWVIFRLRWKVKELWPRYLSAGIIATGVCCLHFLGMLGVTYIADSNVDDTCTRTIEKSDQSPNAWSTHQILVVAISILVPAIGVFVENAINHELLLVYGKQKDKAFDRLVNKGAAQRGSSRITNSNSNDVDISQSAGSYSIMSAQMTHSVIHHHGSSSAEAVPDSVDHHHLGSAADVQDDVLFEEIAIELRDRLARNDSPVNLQKLSSDDGSVENSDDLELGSTTTTEEPSA